MNASIRLIPALLLLVTFHCANCFAQGSLTPPGAPGATMKSLDQIEPRTPVDSVHTPGSTNAGFIISQPGSYYLTTNIIGVSGKNGIEITTSNVTLDLNGFTLFGSRTANNGIYSTGINVVVRNGTIKGWGQTGIEDFATTTADRTFEHLTICSNVNFGIFTSAGGVVRDCVVEGNGEYGIGVNGASRISGCKVDANGDSGIAVFYPGSCIVENNFSYGNDVKNTNSYADIDIASSFNHVENNRVIVGSTVGYGILIESSSDTNNVIFRNDVYGGGAARNYKLQVSNDIGPIGNVTNAANAWANISH